jgi:hypothetical protein
LGYASLALVLCWTAGCANNPGRKGTVDKDELARMQKVRNLAGRFTDAKANKGKTLNTENVKDWAVKNKQASAEDFVSGRDGKDYIIAQAGTGPVVIEAEGKGDRYVVSMEGQGPRSDDEINKMLTQGGPGRGARRGGGAQ